MSTMKTMGIPVMLYILVDQAVENEELMIASGKELILDILEENWEDAFSYENQVMTFEGFEWLQGAWSHTVNQSEEDNANKEAIEISSVSSDGESS